MNKQEKFEELKKIIKQGFENADCRKPYTNEPYPYFDSQITCIANKLIEACHWCEKTIRKNAVEEFAEKLKATAFRMVPNSNEEFIYAQNVDVILVKLLKEDEK